MVVIEKLIELTAIVITCRPSRACQTDVQIIFDQKIVTVGVIRRLGRRESDVDTRVRIVVTANTADLLGHRRPGGREQFGHCRTGIGINSHHGLITECHRTASSKGRTDVVFIICAEGPGAAAHIITDGTGHFPTITLGRS